MSEDQDRQHLDFTREEIVEALAAYARAKGAFLPDDLAGVTFHGLGGSFRREGLYGRLSFQSK